MAQFRWFLELELSLSLDFGRSVAASALQLVGRNPVVILLAVAMPFVAAGRFRKAGGACALAAGALLLFRCFKVEPYNHAYLCHFWAAAALGASLALAALWHRFPVLAAAIGLLALVIGPITAYAKWYEAFAFDHAARNQAILAMAETLPDEAKVIAYSHPYMLLRGRFANLSLMAHHESLDLGDFDAVVATPGPEVLEAKDQWFDALTVEQGRQLREQFGKCAEVPEVRFRPGWWPGSYVPGYSGCAIFGRLGSPVGPEREAPFVPLAKPCPL